MGIELDSLADPADVIADGSPLWGLLDRYRQLGTRDIVTSTDFEPVEKALLLARIDEELGWGDSGLTISLGVADFHRLIALQTGDEQLIEQFASPGESRIGCWAITEPDHGSDTLAFTEAPFSDPSIKADCVARRDGDEYVIKGSKAAWVSNGTIADVAVLFCTIEGDRGFEGGGVCLAPSMVRGLSGQAPRQDWSTRAAPGRDSLRRSAGTGGAHDRGTRRLRLHPRNDPGNGQRRHGQHLLRGGPCQL